MARTTHFFLSAVALALLACKSFEAAEDPTPSGTEGGTDATNGSSSGGIVDAGTDSATCAAVDAGCGSGCCSPLVCNGAQRCATTCRAFTAGCLNLADCCEGLACDSTNQYCCKISGAQCVGGDCCGVLQCLAGTCQ